MVNMVVMGGTYWAESTSDIIPGTDEQDVRADAFEQLKQSYVELVTVQTLFFNQMAMFGQALEAYDRALQQ